jgi:hypothetical protein
MRQELEDSRKAQRTRYAWILALAGIAMTGFSPTTAWAEEEAVEEPPGDTAIDEADEATEAVSPEDIEEAQKSIDEAQRQLDAMKQRIGEQPVKVPSQMPGGAGLVTGEDGTAKKLQVSLNKDGSLYFRFAMWLQVWTRAMQLNPGTTVLGKDENWYGDVGLRRARFLMFGKIAPRTFMLMHIGINNQTFRNARKPQVYFHDAWVEFEASKKGYISIGGGLLYWNGISRATNASTITFMSLDAPIVNWPTIERTDQFARQLGLYLKGKAGLFDYRVAVVRPFSTNTFDVTTGLPPANGVGTYNDYANTWGYSGYFMLQFLDKESNTLPYMVGTYIGAKRVFNWGVGGHGQPNGVAYLDGAGNVRQRWLGIASTDLFLDIPFKAEKGGAATWYGAYYWMDFGPNAIRNIGIMNPGDAGSGTSFNGQGNAYPMIGTGDTLYSELGILIPGTVGKSIQFQPYVNWQGSGFDVFRGDNLTIPAKGDWMHHVGAGLNMFIHRHNAKVTLEYRNRPIFDAAGQVESRKGNSFVLQMHLFI